MKKAFIIFLIAMVVVIVNVIAKTQFKTEGKYNLPTNPANPYLPLWERTPDAEPRIFPDPDTGEERVYVYGSHDASDQTRYCGYRYVVWSAPLTDMSDWRYEGQAFHRDWLAGVINEKGVPHKVHPSESLYAPDVVYNPVTKKYYMYAFTAMERDGAGALNLQYGGDGSARMFVGESTRPAGPFNDKITFCKAGWHDNGTPISRENPPANFTGSMYTGNNPQHLGGFDPGVLVDVVEKDSKGNPTKVRTYLFWGFTWPYAVELEEDMVTLKPGTMKAGDAIIGASIAPVKGPGRFFEASSIRKINDTYVFVYARSGPIVDGVEGAPNAFSQLGYGTSKNPLGPFEYKGIIVDNRGEWLRGDDIPYGMTGNVFDWRQDNTHGNMVKVKDQWFILYHRSTGAAGGVAPGVNNRAGSHRQATADAIDVYSVGDELFIKRAQTTSQGFGINGLDPYKEHDAGIVCHGIPIGNVIIDSRNFVESQWTNRNILPKLEGMDWNPLRIHINNTLNTRVGYRYFNFGKGVSARKNLALVLTMKEEEIAKGITVNVYTADARENYGDKEGRHYMIGSTKLTGNTNLRKVEIPITQNLDELKGMKSIYIEFSSPTSFESTSLTAKGQAICDINKIQFALN
jgi:hypothetical protein